MPLLGLTESSPPAQAGLGRWGLGRNREEGAPGESVLAGVTSPFARCPAPLCRVHSAIPLRIGLPWSTPRLLPWPSHRARLLPAWRSGPMGDSPVVLTSSVPAPCRTHNHHSHFQKAQQAFQSGGLFCNRRVSILGCQDPSFKKIYLFVISSCTSAMSITCSHPNRRAPESPNITPRGFPQGPLCAITTPWEALCLHLSSALPPKLTPLQLSSTWLFKGGRGLDTL